MSFSFRSLSLQQRLPLLISMLLLAIMVTFSWISYIGVKTAALETGKERLRSLASQLSVMFSRSTQSILAATQATANHESVIKVLQPGGSEFRGQALEELQKLRPDSTWVLVELLDINRQPVIYSERDSAHVKSRFDSLQQAFPLNHLAKFGKIYQLGDFMYYPIIAPVTHDNRVTGYLVRWRLLAASPKALEQFSQLIGTKAKLYFGNADGSLWTNMTNVVSYQKIDTGNLRGSFEYLDAKGEKLIAAARPIANTSWLISVEFPEQIVLQMANRFLRQLIIIGGILIIVGILIAWLMSRSLTKPLNKLMLAASAIADGQYSSPVKVHGNDELGKLASAFNSMAVQVQNARQDLENKVIERTVQLEASNRELESYSYSISHDLRAPLRAIIGFVSVLEDEYTNKLDPEAKRITTVIKDSTMKMGQLIDDLLAFSRLGRNEIVKTNINTREMVNEIINELAPVNDGNKIEWIIRPLPGIYGDANMIRQVWTNLISNAIKYSGNKEKPRIETGAFIDKEQATFFVRDNGVGFDEKYKGKLFKVFQRLHRSSEFEGTGVGLAIVEKIISKHGGKVWAEGAAAKGASFYFSLPA
jgi:signal transduction histidine kinase